MIRKKGKSLILFSVLTVVLAGIFGFGGAYLAFEMLNEQEIDGTEMYLRST